jgi:putative addiction module CopG family antidote
MDLNLPPDVVRLIEAKVAGGGFRDAADVVEQAVRLLDEVGPPTEDELRNALDEGRRSGSVAVDLDRLEADLIARIRRRA